MVDRPVNKRTRPRFRRILGQATRRLSENRHFFENNEELGKNAFSDKLLA